MAAALKTRTMTLGELFGAAAGDRAGVEIVDLVMDSRDVSPGAAFIALRGASSHGIEFAAQAFDSGAAIVLYDPSELDDAPPEPGLAVPGLRRQLPELARRFYGDKVAATDVTAITGTNGKTTVAYLVAQALNALGRSCAYIGTLGFGIPPNLTGHRLTTPDCLSLHREIVLLPAAQVALEVSSHALAQHRIEGLSVHMAVFTNLTRDHLDQHGSFENYARTKAALFTRRGLVYAVLNMDDPFAAELLTLIEPEVQVLGVTLTGQADAGLRAVIESSGARGMELSVDRAGDHARFSTSLIGAFNAQNLLLALGALLGHGVTLGDACSALGRCAPPPGRMEAFAAGPDRPAVVVDYAHTPDALARVLEALRALTVGEIWCVFGCGGERDAGKRPLMGRVAADRADHIVLTDDNPRSEDATVIVAGIRSGIGPDADVAVEHDRRAAIARAIRSAGPDDVVLVAGKGHERRQVLADGARPFDDREVVAETLRTRS